MKKQLLVFLLVLVSVGAFATACGRHGGKPDPEKAHKFISWQVDETLDDLEANDDQRKTIHSAKDRVFDAGLTFMTNSREHRKALVDQLLSDSPNAEEMHKRVDQWAEEVRILGHLAVDESLGLHKTLTADQRAKLAEMIAERTGH
jgi:Spy/CpxP family protein refolding chaperone